MAKSKENFFLKSLTCSFKCTLLFLLALISIQSVYCCDAWAEDPLKIHGKIILKKTGKWNSQIPQSRNIQSSGKDEVILDDSAAINFCITEGNVVIGPVKRRISVNNKTNYTITKARTKCIDKNNPKKVYFKQPGHKNSANVNIIFQDVSGLEGDYPPAYKKTGVSFSPIAMSQLKSLEDFMKVIQDAPSLTKRGKYTLGAGTESLIMISGTQQTSFHDACENKENKSFIRYMPAKAGKEMEFSISRNDPDDFSAIIFIPIEPWPLSASWEIDFIPQGCSGTEEIQNDKDQQFYATWSLKPADKCDDILEHIEHDLSYAKAYNDRDLQTEDIKYYECMVDELTWFYWKGERVDNHCKPKPGEDKESHVTEEAPTDVGVDEDCNIQREEMFRELQAGSCRPEGETEGVIHHEKIHQKQCKEHPEVYNAAYIDPSAKGYIEVEAHLAGVEYMLDWMDKNCQGSNTRKYRNQIKEIRDKWKNNPWHSRVN